MSYLTNDQLSDLSFNHNLFNLFQQIKKMKLTTCVSHDKNTNTTDYNKIIKKSITKRSAGTNEIYFKMDDFMSWSIHEHNFNEIVVTEDSIQLFDNINMSVTFIK